MILVCGVSRRLCKGYSWSRYTVGSVGQLVVHYHQIPLTVLPHRQNTLHMVGASEKWHWYVWLRVFICRFGYSQEVG